MERFRQKPNKQTKYLSLLLWIKSFENITVFIKYTFITVIRTVTLTS